MTSYVAWNEISPEHVARAGGEAAVEAGKREMLAGRVSQIERGKISGRRAGAERAQPGSAWPRLVDGE